MQSARSMELRDLMSTQTQTQKRSETPGRSSSADTVLGFAVLGRCGRRLAEQYH